MNWGLEGDTIATVQVVLTGGGRRRATSVLEIARLRELGILRG